MPSIRFHPFRSVPAAQPLWRAASHGGFDEAEALVVLPAIVFAAARQARGSAAHGTYAADLYFASRARVSVRSALLAAGQGKRVAARLIVQAQVVAGLLPLGAVRRDAAASGPVMRKQVREFVPERAVHLRFTECAEPLVEHDQTFGRPRRAGVAAHARVPADREPGKERGSASAGEESFRRGEEYGIFNRRSRLCRRRARCGHRCGREHRPRGRRMAAEQRAKKVQLHVERIAQAGCQRAKISASACAVASISARVVDRPSEKRTADRAISGDRPIASNTCEGSTLPTMQADPLEAPIPARSSDMSRLSAS